MTLTGWIKEGGGTKPEAVRLGGMRVTTAEVLRRFAEASPMAEVGA